MAGGVKASAADIERIYSLLRDSLVRDMARRMARMGSASAMTGHQMEIYEEAGGVFSYAVEQIAKANDTSAAAVSATFRELESDTEHRFGAMYGDSAVMSPRMEQLTAAAIRSTNGHLRNLTNTTAGTVYQSFIQQAGLANLQVSTGAFSFPQAVSGAVKNLATAGVKTIIYTGSGRQIATAIEVAVRRAVLTGAGQLHAQLSVGMGEELGTDLYEVSAHAGARPAHAEWQGGIYSLHGTHPDYPGLVEATGYGSGEGLYGWNCYHDMWPFVDGYSVPFYTKEELERYKNATVDVNGQQVPQYQASQMQRGLERRIRSTKHELSALDGAIGGATDAGVRQRLVNDFNVASVKLKQQEAALRSFVNETGLRPDSSRVQVPGFGQSVAQKAVWGNRKELEKYTALRYNKSGNIIPTDDWTDKKHVALPAVYKPFAVVDTVSGKAQQKNRTFYDADGAMERQIHTGPHNNPKRHSFGEHGEHAHDKIWEDDKLTNKDVGRELTDDERKENADIL